MKKGGNLQSIKKNLKKNSNLMHLKSNSNSDEGNSAQGGLSPLKANQEVVQLTFVDDIEFIKQYHLENVSDTPDEYEEEANDFVYEGSQENMNKVFEKRRPNNKSQRKGPGLAGYGSKTSASELNDESKNKLIGFDDDGFFKYHQPVKRIDSDSENEENKNQEPEDSNKKTATTLRLNMSHLPALLGQNISRMDGSVPKKGNQRGRRRAIVGFGNSALRSQGNSRSDLRKFKEDQIRFKNSSKHEVDIINGQNEGKNQDFDRTMSISRKDNTSSNSLTQGSVLIQDIQNNDVFKAVVDIIDSNFNYGNKKQNKNKSKKRRNNLKFKYAKNEEDNPVLDKQNTINIQLQNYQLRSSVVHSTNMENEAFKRNRDKVLQYEAKNRALLQAGQRVLEEQKKNKRKQKIQPQSSAFDSYMKNRPDYLDR